MTWDETLTSLKDICSATWARRLWLACFAALCLWASPSWAQEEGQEEAPTEEVSEEAPGFVVPLDWFIVPIIGYSPDTSVALASISLLRFRFAGESEASRPSTLALLVTWTLKNQIYVQVGPLPLF